MALKLKHLKYKQFTLNRTWLILKEHERHIKLQNLSRQTHIKTHTYICKCNERN